MGSIPIINNEFKILDKKMLKIGNITPLHKAIKIPTAKSTILSEE